MQNVKNRVKIFFENKQYKMILLLSTVFLQCFWNCTVRPLNYKVVALCFSDAINRLISVTTISYLLMFHTKDSPFYIVLSLIVLSPIVLSPIALSPIAWSKGLRYDYLKGDGRWGSKVYGMRGGLFVPYAIFKK